jgi:hypothetical protein
MDEETNNTGDDTGIKAYVIRHMLIGVVLAVVAIIALKIIFGLLQPPDRRLADVPDVAVHDRVGEDAELSQASHVLPGDAALREGHETPLFTGSGAMSGQTTGLTVREISTHESDGSQPHDVAEQKDLHQVPENSSFEETPQRADIVDSVKQETTSAHAPAAVGAAEHTPQEHGADEPEAPSFPVEGMAFVDAVIRPLDHELNRRFYGWRPNDILNFTDNVNNFQLGVLEVTRRTAVILAERISRTGSNAAFDANLQNAMNWFMIKADRYWFPSAESKYKAGLMELRTYFQRLGKKEAQFYSRTDNLIPLLMAYQDLLGSCDENLVKFKEDDGSSVSFFKSDDYFFYAKGVASAMTTILEGIVKDFSVMVVNRGGMEELHHAIESCHHAMEIDPWVVLNNDLSSLFANHRMNMAAPISHARFFLGVLITALST